MIIGEQIRDTVWDLRVPLWEEVRGQIGSRVVRVVNGSYREFGTQILWGPIHGEIQEAG